jgi:spermidine/putrescine transport system permease protein
VTAQRTPADTILNIYLTLFLIYLFLPLGLMCLAAFNAYDQPSVTVWQGFTLKWFGVLFADERLMQGLWNSLVIAAGVITLSLPLGLAGALLLTRMRSKARGFLYAVLVTPILTPGIIIGISTLVFWRNFNLSGGLFLAMLAQASFIASYCMLMFMARLQRFDLTQEEAALDLGASHWLVFRRILLPFMLPTMLTAAVIAFLQSFENYNTTVFAIGGGWTLVTEMGSRFRFGLSPAINAVGVIFAVITIVCAVLYVRFQRPAASG